MNLATLALDRSIISPVLVGRAHELERLERARQAEQALLDAHHACFHRQIGFKKRSLTAPGEAREGRTLSLRNPCKVTIEAMLFLC